MQVFRGRAWDWTLSYATQSRHKWMAKEQRGSLLKKKLFLRPHHFVRSLYIVDVRKDAAVIFNVENLVSRALRCVHMVVTEKKHVFLTNSSY